jgi:Holliday junction DNA helicase RuvA
MIGKLSGRIDEVGEAHLILDVGGVGYLVFCSGKTLGRIGQAGASAALLIETHVREDHIHLYGFADAAERAWFRLLGTVQGVGSKVALALLSALTPGDLARAIAAQDKAALTQANGVGAKLAARLLTELKDKVGEIALGPAASLPGTALPAAGQLGAAADDAVAALEGLGYRRVEAFAAVARAGQALKDAGGDGAKLEALIKAALKELSR